jgi:hypothetical protein
MFSVKSIGKKIVKRNASMEKGVDVIALKVPYCAQKYRKYSNAWKSKQKMKLR